MVLETFLFSLDPRKPSIPIQSSSNSVLPLSPVDSPKAKQAEVRKGIFESFLFISCSSVEQLVG